MTTTGVTISPPAHGEWIVRREVDDSIAARGFASGDEARKFCGGFDDVYACRYQSTDYLDVFADRYDELIADARSLDEDWEHLNMSLAADALDAVEADFPPVEGDEPFMRFACLIWAMQRALDDAREDYVESRPHPSRSGWESETFPKAVLGLH